MDTEQDIGRMKELAGLTEDHLGRNIQDYDRITTDLIDFINQMSNCLSEDKLFYAEKAYNDSRNEKHEEISKAKAKLAKNIIGVIKRNRDSDIGRY